MQQLAGSDPGNPIEIRATLRHHSAGYATIAAGTSYSILIIYVSAIVAQMEVSTFRASVVVTRRYHHKLQIFIPDQAFDCCMDSGAENSNHGAFADQIRASKQPSKRTACNIENGSGAEITRQAPSKRLLVINRISDCGRCTSPISRYLVVELNLPNCQDFNTPEYAGHSRALDACCKYLLTSQSEGNNGIRRSTTSSKPETSKLMPSLAL